MFVVTVSFVIEKEHIGAFREAMIRQARNSLTRESGCLQFDVCQDPAHPERFFLYELYTSDAAFEDHLKTAHFMDFDATVKPWTVAKQAEQWLRLED